MNIKQRQLLIRILKKMTQNPEYAKTHGLCDVSSIKVSRQKTQPQRDTSQSVDIPCLQSFDQSQSGTSLSADTPSRSSSGQAQPQS